MPDIIGTTFSIADAFVRAKFPKDYGDPLKRRTVFEMIELVGDELTAKNMKLIMQPYLSRIPKAEDHPCFREYKFVAS